MFDTVLVANRGEIAVRVIRTLRALGVRSVAVFSDADADARHVREADTAVRLGPAPAAESYLSVERLLQAAARTGAQAVHPGYGFLAENAGFARACADAGLVFIGPPADAISLMGDKIRAKRTVAAAGVPVVPGRDEPGLSDAELEEVQLSTRGRLWSYTDANYQPPDPYVPVTDPHVPFAIAAVELEAERIVVMGQVVAGITVEDLRVGMEMELVLDTLFSEPSSEDGAQDGDTVEYMIWKWRPAEEAAR